MWNFRICKKKIPVVNLELETKTIEVEMRKVELPPYVEPTDKEMIEGLEECGYYDEAFRIRNLKKENANLKRKLTILQKKYDGVIQP